MIVYKITNIINDKNYIGITSRNLTSRWNEHVYDSNSNKTNMNIHKAIRKYGKDNFVIEQLYIGSNTEEINNKEIEYIKEYNSLDRNYGYNISPGGNNKHICTLESKAKMSLSRQKAWKNGKYSNQEYRDKISKAKTGIKVIKLQKKVICLETNEIFDSIKKASENYKVTPGAICNSIKRGSKINKQYTLKYTEATD